MYVVLNFDLCRFGPYSPTYGRFIFGREKSHVSVALLLLMGGDGLFSNAMYVKEAEACLTVGC